MIKLRRKPSARTLLLVLLPLTLLVGFAYGYVARIRHLPPHGLAESAYQWVVYQDSLRNLFYVFRKNVSDRERRTGFWNEMNRFPEAQGMDEEQQEAMSKLLSIGYLSGYEAPSGLENVTVYDPEYCHNGFNLYTSGHGPEAVLMDMTGHVRHRWRYGFREAFPDYPEPPGSNYHMDYWRRVHLYSNGDVLAVFEGFGMIKVDKDSNLLWAIDRRCHHDLFVDEAGDIHVLTRRVRVLPRINSREPVLEDFITVLDPDGTLIREVSVLEAFERSPYASHLEKMVRSGDLLHTNTLEILDGSQAHRASIFARGNALISLLNLNVIAIVDPEAQKVVWALSGQWTGQHQPTLLENGNLLLFDNQGHHGVSKVIELDPFTQEIVWSYEGDSENGFSSTICGSSIRLPNANTLVTESTGGRAFEVTPEKEIVWEFYNPARAGEDETLIATLLEVIRLDPGVSLDWLEGSPNREDGEVNAR